MTDVSSRWWIIGFVASAIAFAALLLWVGPLTPLWLFLVASSSLLFVTSAGVLLIRAGRQKTREADERYHRATIEIFNNLEGALPPGTPKLEDEIAEVSGTLADTVGRLRDISVKAQAFEAEVQEMVQRAEAAKATAELSEEAAQRIGYLLNSRTEERLREEIEKLSTVHTTQIGQLRKSGNRMALLTFAGGVVLGTVGNVIVAAWMG